MLRYVPSLLEVEKFILRMANDGMLSIVAAALVYNRALLSGLGLAVTCGAHHQRADQAESLVYDLCLIKAVSMVLLSLLKTL